MKKKFFIITVDTEGDNLWKWHSGDAITTKNAEYIYRFQNLCEKYNFKPVYLINYEMAQTDSLVELLKDKANKGLCEIGMHLHAWNSPPEYELVNKYNGCAYITEYPENIVRQKHRFLVEYIEKRFGIRPVSYRAGRWATNDSLFKVLDELGFLVDCSITPGITHERNVGMSVASGNNYQKEKNGYTWITKNLIEVPMTSYKTRSIHGVNLKNRLSHLIKGEELWLRPATSSYDDMIRLTNIIEGMGNKYLEFMIHSSELMPGCSPYCKNEEAVEAYYNRMEQYFQYVYTRYQGITLSSFWKIISLEGVKKS